MTKIATSIVGCDISKTRVDVHVLPSGQAFSVAMGNACPEGLAERLTDLNPELVVMEATGGLQQRTADALLAAGMPVAVVNPRQIRDFGRATGRLAKTDRIDAAIIARFGQALNPAPNHHNDPERRKLKALVTRRRQVVSMRAAEKTRAHACGDPRMTEDIADTIAYLSAKIAGLDRAINTLIHAHWPRANAIVRSMKGVGPVLAATLLAEMPELGTLTRRQAAALVGTAPYNRDSGAWRGKRTVWGGRKAIREVLYMAAVTASRTNPTMARFGQRLLAKGKAKKVALTAIMRKMIVTLNAMLRDNKPCQT